VACERALAKNPGERPSASAFIAMLSSGGEPATAVLEPAGVTTPAAGSVRPRASRRGVWVGSVIGVVLLLIAALVLALAGGGAPSSPGRLRATPTPTRALEHQITVPALDGLPVAEAIHALSAAGLAADVVQAPGKPGVVVGVSPAAGTSLGPGDSVTIFVGGGGHAHGHGDHRGGSAD
jgi:hypothetical protein